MSINPYQNRLFARLDDIASNLSKEPHVLALLTLGSVGLETNRIDQYSDLDFFVIVEDGYATHYLENTEWLNTSSPLSFFFQNTRDGFKLLYQDGIYGECAIFDQSRLKDITYRSARLHYRKEGIQYSFPPSNTLLGERPTKEFLLNEALTNMYVGLLRFQRGETYSSFQFICNYALMNTLKLALYDEVVDDPFDVSRRIERNHPALIPLLKTANQGYEKINESAFTIINYLESHYTLNQYLLAKIKSMIR